MGKKKIKPDGRKYSVLDTYAPAAARGHAAAPIPGFPCPCPVHLAVRVCAPCSHKAPTLVLLPLLPRPCPFFPPLALPMAAACRSGLNSVGFCSCTRSLYTDTVIPLEFQPEDYTPTWCWDIHLLKSRTDL